MIETIHALKSIGPPDYYLGNMTLRRTDRAGNALLDAKMSDGRSQRR